MNGYRFYACVFFSLILLLGTSYGDVNNILVNPGFETGTTGWAAYGGSFKTITSPNTPSPHTGTYVRNGIQQNWNMEWNSAECA